MKRTHMAFLALTLAVLVGTAARASDEQIATQIIQRLQQQQQISQLQGFNIGVQVEQGTVTVMGTVSETDHALLALDVARRVPGVKLVVNDLYVQPAGTPAQPAQAQAVAPATAMLETGIKSPTITAPSSSPIKGLEVASPTLPQPTAPALPQMAASQPVSRVAAAAPIGTGAAMKPSPQAPAVPAKLAPQASAPMAQPIASAPRAPQRVAQKPVAFAPAQSVPTQPANFYPTPVSSQAAAAQYSYQYPANAAGGPVAMAMGAAAGGAGIAQASYDNPQMPGYAWPSYAAYPNYAALTYPHQYSATAWPYIGPFYPYPQVPLGWRKVSLEWDDGWWFLDFKSKTKH